MRKIIGLFLLFVGTMYSQNNIVNYNLLKINNVLLDANKNIILSSLGINQLPIAYVSELTNEEYDKYDVNHNDFYFSGDKLVAFSLDNPTYSFMTPSIKVGASITNLATAYPISYSNREVINGLGFIIINLQLNSGVAADEFIVINYNSANVITSIHLSEY